MTEATVTYHNRIALIFEFDETLAPDTFTALLEHCGLDPDQFHEDRIAPLLELGWDKKLARFHCLIEESRRRDDLTIGADTLAEVGRSLELYPEVAQMFDRVRQYAQQVVPDVEVEFYLLTADMHAGRRVENLALSDYREDSELMKSLRLAVESIAKRIALRRMSQAE